MTTGLDRGILEKITIVVRAMILVIMAGLTMADTLVTMAIMILILILGLCPLLQVTTRIGIATTDTDLAVVGVIDDTLLRHIHQLTSLIELVAVEAVTVEGPGRTLQLENIVAATTNLRMTN